MKLSKSLLSAILIGIALQTATSCKKENNSPDPKSNQQAKQQGEKTHAPDPCAACGMG